LKRLKRQVAFVCLVLSLFIGIAPSSIAGIVAKPEGKATAMPLSQQEIAALASKDKRSGDLENISSGDDQFLALIGAVALVLVLLAAVAGTNNNSSTSK
jgi:hypothetical protein